MSRDLSTLLRIDIPAAFAEGFAALQRESETDPQRKARFDDVRMASGTARIRFEGEGGFEVCYALRDGVLSATEALEPSLPLRFGLIVPLDAALEGLRELDERGHVGRGGELAKRAVSFVSRKAEKLAEKEKLSFHLTLRDLPTRDDFTIKIGINVEAPVDHPAFTASISYEDLEAVRDKSLPPQKFLLGGRIRTTGDASRAIALALQLMQIKR